MEFCDRLAQQTKRPYRLPTEAEWEYACRAGTTTPFHVGPTLTPAVANYNGRYPAPSADGPEGGSRGQTTPVDHFGVANAVGLCDLHGNVFEWRQDHWHDTYDGARSDGRAWLSPGEPNGCLYDGALPDAWLCPGKCSRRVTRGGAWSGRPEGLPLRAPPLERGHQQVQLHRVPRGLLGSQNVGVFEIRRLPTVKEVTSQKTPAQTGDSLMQSRVILTG